MINHSLLRTNDGASAGRGDTEDTEEDGMVNRRDASTFVRSKRRERTSAGQGDAEEERIG